MSYVSRKVNMGLPPKHGKAPAGTLITDRKSENPSPWLDVEGSTLGFTDHHSGPSQSRSVSDSLACMKSPDSLRILTTTIGNDGSGSSNVDPMPFECNVTSVPVLVDKIKTMENPLLPSDEKPNSDDEVAAIMATWDTTTVKTESDVNNQYKWMSQKLDPKMDPRKIKRVMANRLSAQKSRLKKLEYISELERRVNSLQIEVNLISAQVSHYKGQGLILRMENNNMKQRIACLMDDKVFKDAQTRALREERERLMQLFMLQQQLQQQQVMNGFELNQPPNFGINGINNLDLNYIM